MKPDVYIPKTLSAQFGSAYTRLRVFWPPDARLAAVALYYRAYGYRLAWNAKKRQMEITVAP